ncbi:hypothetical protein Bca4012_065103 [Brassica carinata]
MVAYHTFFSAVRTGRCSGTVVTRLLRFWETREGGELIGLDMLLLDKEATLIQGRRADTNSEVEWEGMQAQKLPRRLHSTQTLSQDPIVGTTEADIIVDQVTSQDIVDDFELGEDDLVDVKDKKLNKQKLRRRIDQYKFYNCFSKCF